MAVLDSQGATLSIDSAAGTPVLIECIRSFEGMTGEASEIDITCLTSTAKEFRQGLQDFGTITIELMRDPRQVGQIELEAAKAAQATRTFILTLDSGDIATFEGFVKSLTTSGAVDEALTGTAVIRITGPVVWTVAAP
jgi:hypothetical protein